MCVAQIIPLECKRRIVEMTTHCPPVDLALLIFPALLMLSAAGSLCLVETQVGDLDGIIDIADGTNQLCLSDRNAAANWWSGNSNP